MTGGITSIVLAPLIPWPATTDEFITRMEFVGGKFIYAVRVYAGGSFELCPADACEVAFGDAPTANASNQVATAQQSGPRFEIQSEHDELLARKLERFLARHGIEVAGIEFIRNPDGTTVIYDINTNTNYNAAAEAAAGINDGGMSRIARFLADELELLAHQSRAKATA